MITVFLSLIVGIAIFIVVFNLFGDDSHLDAKMSRRLKEIKKYSYDSPDLHNKDIKLNQNMKFLIQDTEYKIVLLGKILDRIVLTEKLKKMLRIADVKMTVDIFLAFSVILPAICMLLALLVPSKSFLFIVCSFCLLYLPFFIVKMKIKRKLDLFTQQFPDALGLISSSLRAGHSLTSSFQMVVHEMPEPINNVFKIVIDEIALGKDTRDALENMDQFLPGSLDLKFFITAVLIQREIGGNLAEILDNLNYTIRERFKLIGQLKSQTAQAQLSGIILGLAPVFLGIIIGIINPNYLKPLFENILGQILMVFSILWSIIGFVIIKQITNIKV
jgi:tight adherence protein B